MEKIRKIIFANFKLKKVLVDLENYKIKPKWFFNSLMIDQRVSQGIKSKFFNQKAFTTTIPAQF
jgi:KDO2-lipid IV(A) lauroyltransferase